MRGREGIGVQRSASILPACTGSISYGIAGKVTVHSHRNRFRNKANPVPVVIPAKAGIQEKPMSEKHPVVYILDSRLRGNDGEERE